MFSTQFDILCQYSAKNTIWLYLHVQERKSVTSLRFIYVFLRIWKNVHAKTEREITSTHKLSCKAYKVLSLFLPYKVLSLFNSLFKLRLL